MKYVNKCALIYLLKCIMLIEYKKIKKSLVQESNIQKNL